RPRTASRGTSRRSSWRASPAGRRGRRGCASTSPRRRGRPPSLRGVVLADRTADRLVAALALGAGAGVAALAEVPALGLELPEALVAARVELAALEGRGDRAARLAGVPAVAEPAALGERGDIVEAGRAALARGPGRE